jgi:predicted component of type VI protein secretion system
MTEYQKNELRACLLEITMLNPCLSTPDLINSINADNVIDNVNSIFNTIRMLAQLSLQITFDIHHLYHKVVSKLSELGLPDTLEVYPEYSCEQPKI